MAVTIHWLKPRPFSHLHGSSPCTPPSIAIKHNRPPACLGRAQKNAGAPWWRLSLNFMSVIYTTACWWQSRFEWPGSNEQWTKRIVRFIIADCQSGVIRLLRNYAVCCRTRNTPSNKPLAAYTWQKTSSGGLMSCDFTTDLQVAVLYELRSIWNLYISTYEAIRQSSMGN